MSANGHMTPAALDREMQRMNDVVRSARHRFFKGAATGFNDNDEREGVTWDNPLDELIAREEQAQRDAALASIDFLIAEGAELPLWFQERVKAMVFEQFQQYENALLEWIFAAGPHPIEVMKRLFAYAKMKRASLLWNMGFRALGKLFKESHENFRLLTRMLFADAPAGWKKGRDARDKMKASAQGNNNRRGGNKMRPRR